jgi:hypothetical protein
MAFTAKDQQRPLDEKSGCGEGVIEPSRKAQDPSDTAECRPLSSRHKDGTRSASLRLLYPPPSPFLSQHGHFVDFRVVQGTGMVAPRVRWVFHVVERGAPPSTQTRYDGLLRSPACACNAPYDHVRAARRARAASGNRTGIVERAWRRTRRKRIRSNSHRHRMGDVPLRQSLRPARLRKPPQPRQPPCSWPSSATRPRA